MAPDADLPTSEPTSEQTSQQTSQQTPAGATPGGQPRAAVSDDEWRVRLSPEEFRVLRLSGTEAPWTGEYVDTKARGTYRCRACGAPLFVSDTKFDSHCGWPSFDRAIPGAIRYLADHSLGMVRTEVRCASCDSHLGHRFDGEGYTPADARYCINSICLRLEPAAGTDDA